MTVFVATFTNVAVAAAQDLFEIVPSASTRLRIREIRIGQFSDAGDAASELLSLTILRGNTTSGSGGSTVTPANVRPWSRAAETVVEVNNTTIASGGSPVTVLSDTWNIQAGWIYAPPKDEQIRVEALTRLVVRLSAPLDSLSVNGTIVFEEIGLGLES